MPSLQQLDSDDYSRSNTLHGHDSDSPEQYALLPYLPNSHPANSKLNHSTVFSYEEPVSNESNLRRRWTSPRTSVPATVLIVHIFLLIFSWTFFGLTIGKPVALSSNLAIKVKEHFQSVIMVMTLIASAISFISSFYYALAIRYSLVRFLAKRASLFTVASAVRMSQGSLIQNFKRPRWTIIAFLCLIALNAQTAGWTTLMTPRMIEIQSQITGYELDLKSPAFQNLFAASSLSTDPNLFSQVLGVTEASGSTAVGTYRGLPSILNFNHFSYTNSTMGVMPVATEEVDSKITVGTKLPVRVNITKEHETPQGFSTRFLLTQQGFTAQVSCQQRKLDKTTQPSLDLRHVEQSLAPAINASVTLAQIVVVCPGTTNPTPSAPVITTPNLDAVFAVSCPVDQIDGRKRWDLILTGSGKYKPIDTMICNIFPQINLVNVNYTGSTQLFNSSCPKFINGSASSWGGEDAPWLGNFSLSIFLRGLHGGQSLSGNSMGDTILSFLPDPVSPSELQEILAQYIRGAVEVGVTILRTAYTEKNNRLYPNGSSEIPAGMTSTINGTHWAETIGWHQSSETASSVLIAPSWLSFITICIIVRTLVKKRGDEEPEVNRYFDPSDLLHIISAASAGGMSVDFPAYDEKTEDYSESITVTLAPVGGPGTKSGFINHDI